MPSAKKTTVVRCLCLAAITLGAGCAQERGRFDSVLPEAPRAVPAERVRESRAGDQIAPTREIAEGVQRELSIPADNPVQTSGSRQGQVAIGEALLSAESAGLSKTIRFTQPGLSGQDEFAARIRTRSTDPDNAQSQAGSNLRKGAVELIVDDPGIPAGAGGVMELRTQAPGKESAASVAAKAVFSPAMDEYVTVEFDYMFVDQTGPDAELVVYVSDLPEVSDSLVPVARVRAPAPGRAGSAESGRFAVFSASFPLRELNLESGAYVEVELRGHSACAWIDNLDPEISCYKPKRGDICQAFGVVNIIDALCFIDALGTSPVPAHMFCLDFVKDNIVDWQDFIAHTLCITEGNCPFLQAGSASSDGLSGTPLEPIRALGIEYLDQSVPIVVFGKPSTEGPDIPPSYLYAVDGNGTCAGDAVEAPCPSTPCEGGVRIVRDNEGHIYQVNGTRGVIREDTNSVVVAPNEIEYGGSLVTIAINDDEGIFLVDAAFEPGDPNTVYVVPVLVDPQDGNCPYRAAAKLELSGGGSYDLVKLYGKNPATDPCQTITPEDCNVDIVYEPDVQHLREIEIDPNGNLFVLSAHWTNANHWVLIYDEEVGNDSEVRVWLSDPNDSDPDVNAPTAMLVSSSGEKLYLASSVDSANDLATEVYAFSVDQNDHNATGLSYDKTFDINCPEPNICLSDPNLCDSNSGYMCFISSIVENPSGGTLYVTGISAPRFAEDEELPPEVDRIFTTPMLAVLPADTNDAVDAAEISDCDPNLPLALPFSTVWVGTCWSAENCGGQPKGDATCDGSINLADMFALKADFGKTAPWTGNECCVDFNHDDSVNLADLTILKANFDTSGYSPSTGNQDCPP